MFSKIRNNIWMERFLSAVVAGSLLTCAFFDNPWRTNPELARFKSTYAAIKRDVERSSDGHSLAISFEGVPVQLAGIGSQFYFLGNYILWPHRIYATRSPVVINDGGEFLATNFSPDRNWLEQHDVQGVVTYFLERSSRGKVGIRARFRPTDTFDPDPTQPAITAP